MTENVLIVKRRKKRAIKRLAIFFSFFIGLLITLCLKLPIFNISNIIVKNNDIITDEKIIENSGITLGTNMFYFSTKEIENRLLLNPYILKVHISRRIPNVVIINIEERNTAYLYTKDNSQYILDENGIVLEQNNDGKKGSLVEIAGLDLKVVELGEQIAPVDEKNLKFLKEFKELLTRSTEQIPINRMDFSEKYNIKIYYNQVVIRLGDTKELEKKMNYAINIIKSQGLEEKKAEVNVTYLETPTFLILN